MMSQRFALAALTAALLAPATLAAQGTPATAPDTTMQIGEFMTPEEAAATGIANMTPAQRAAFERWLDRYTAVVARVSRRMPAGEHHAMHHAESGHQMHGNASAGAMRGGDRGRAASYFRDGRRVTEILQGGGFVRLADGSLWEIHLADRPTADAWKAGSFVVVHPRNIRLSSGDRAFESMLYNAEAGTTATARFRGLGPIDELTTERSSP